MNYNDRLFAQKPSDRRPTCGMGDLLAPLLMWNRDLVRSKTPTCTGTSSECPKAPCSSSAHQQLLWVSTGFTSGNNEMFTARLLLC